jgi:hypothetical protein
MFFYLESGVSPYANSQWLQQRNSIKFCANLRKSVMETLSLIRQTFAEESIRHARRNQTHRDQKWQDRRRAKSRALLIIFFDIKEIAHKEFVFAGQTANSAHYCDVLRQLRENVQRLRSELWRQKELAAAS